MAEVSEQTQVAGFAETIEILRIEKELVRELLELSQKEHTFLIAGDIEGLSNTVAAMEGLVQRLKRTTEARIFLTSNLLGSTKGEEIEREGDPYLTTLKELGDIAREIGRVNAENRFLVENLLAYVDFFSRAALGDVASENSSGGPFTYTKTGSKGAALR